jgi:hypothetical protein
MLAIKRICLISACARKRECFKQGIQTSRFKGYPERVEVKWASAKDYPEKVFLAIMQGSESKRSGPPQRIIRRELLFVRMQRSGPPQMIFVEGNIFRTDAAKRVEAKPAAANDFRGRKYISYGCSEASRSEAGRSKGISGKKN